MFNLPSSFWLIAKSTALSEIFLGIFYVLDNTIGNDPYFRNIEDYLQFVTPFYAITIIFFNHDAKPALKQLGASLAVVTSVVYLLKYFINATRPNGVGGYSFPSGHTSFAFTAAAFVHKRYSFYYALPAYINSALIGYLRVFHHKHHVVDVVCGAIIAIAITYKITSRKNV